MRTSLIIMVALAAACGSQGGGGRAITVNIDGGAGRTIYFDKFVNGRPEHVDSTVLDGEGRGVLHVPRLPLDFYALTIGQGQQTILALDSTDEVTIEAKLDSMFMPGRIEGSAMTAALVDFYRRASGLEREMNLLFQQNPNGMGDPAMAARINQLQQDYQAFCRKAASDNLGTPIALSAVSKLNMQQDMALCDQVVASLEKTMPRSGFFRSYRDQVMQTKQQLAQQQAQQQQMNANVPIGGEAPDFTQKTPDGRDLSLSDLRGKVVLVDFWASWCRPCRMENPNVVAAYNKYKGKGFEVFSVSLDKVREPWLAAIEQDGLVWKSHVSDLQGWQNAAAMQYGIQSIPFSLLVDRDGKVIDRNLRGAALEQKLAEVLGS